MVHLYRSAVPLPAGVSMGGYGPDRLSTRASDALQVHGLRIDAPPGGSAVELCCIDALYAGDLNASPAPGARRIFAASHTHTAPMLDSGKPELGAVTPQALAAFQATLAGAPRVEVQPTQCTVYRGEAALPVYRRFDRPRSAFNRLLAKHAGLYPNEAVAIDRGLRLFVYGDGERALFAIAHHACHPVTRHDVRQLSPDYVQAIRDAVAERFGVAHCLFLLGCTGDVRPNFARKRADWLPRSRLNWRFAFPPTLAQEAMADEMYRSAVLTAQQTDSFELGPQAWRCDTRRIDVGGFGPVEVAQLQLGGGFELLFLPFEVSHHYHTEVQSVNNKRFVVSCVDDVKGYLPHATQLEAGGYEVDGSRACMGLAQRISVEGPLW